MSRCNNNNNNNSDKFILLGIVSAYDWRIGSKRIWHENIGKDGKKIKFVTARNKFIAHSIENGLTFYDIRKINSIVTKVENKNHVSFTAFETGKKKK